MPVGLKFCPKLIFYEEFQGLNIVTKIGLMQMPRFTSYCLVYTPSIASSVTGTLYLLSCFWLREDPVNMVGVGGVFDLAKHR